MSDEYDEYEECDHVFAPVCCDGCGAYGGNFCIRCGEERTSDFWSKYVQECTCEPLLMGGYDDENIPF